MEQSAVMKSKIEIARNLLIINNIYTTNIAYKILQNIGL